MRSLIGFIAFAEMHSRIALLLLLLLSQHQHYVCGGNTETDINLMPPTAPEHQHIAAFTNDNGNFFHSDGEMMENSDVETVPITVGNDGGNASIGNHAGKLYNWDDYMGSIDMYSENGDYDYGEWTFSIKQLSINMNMNDGQYQRHWTMYTANEYWIIS